MAVPDGINMSFELVAKYSMATDNVTCVYQQADMSGAGDYDYIILLDDGNEQVNSWIYENYPKQAGRRVIDVKNDLWIVRSRTDALEKEYTMAKEQLQSIDDFSEYLRALKNKDYIIFMSVKTEGTERLSDDEMAGLSSLGLDVGIQGQFGLSLYAVINGNKVHSENARAVLVYEERMEDEKLNCRISSAGIHLGDSSSIVLNGTDFSLNQRGFNIAVYSRKYGALLDCVSFDTYVRSGALR